MNAFDIQGNLIQFGDTIGQGGEATVFRVLHQPGEIAKIYRPTPRRDYPEKLAWMAGHPPQNPTASLAHPSLAWPENLLFDSRRSLVGYTMPLIRPAVPILDVYNPRRRAAVMPRFDRRYLHRVARNLSAAIGALHARGYVAGDLNESNILVTPSALITLIDTDSFQVEEIRDGRVILHYCPVAKFEYLPPELQGKSLDRAYRSPVHDSFALAVLIFQLLMDGNHPFRAQWLGKGEPPPIEARIAQGAFPYTAAPRSQIRPPRGNPDLNRLHPAVAELVRRCFIDGHADPRLRPLPSAWERALAEAEHALIACPAGHIYSGHLNACPECPPPSRYHLPVHPYGPGTTPNAPPKKEPPKSDHPFPVDRIVPPSPKPAPPQPKSTPPPGTPAARSPGKPPAASNPKPVKPAMSTTWRNIYRPQINRRSLVDWAGPRVAKSILIGGTLGAAAGAVPGALVAAASRSLGEAVAWSLLFALGGAAGGLLRGWKPGYRLGAWLNTYLGWTLFWQGLGVVVGASLGLMAGMVFWWAIFPVILGAVLGARLGAAAGRWFWQANRRFGWERLWAVICGVAAAALGWQLAGWAAAGGLSDLVTGWIGGVSIPAGLLNNFPEPAGTNVGLVWTWLLAGALCGGLGGAMAGMIADLFGRLSGLTD